MADQSTMPSQDDDSEEVSVTSLHDVMSVMTRRFEELPVKQDERQAKLFVELLMMISLMLLCKIGARM